MIPHPHNHPATFTSTERATEKEATAQATSGICKQGVVWEHAPQDALLMGADASGVRTHLSGLDNCRDVRNKYSGKRMK
jgi:hypothetical protein